MSDVSVKALVAANVVAGLAEKFTPKQKNEVIQELGKTIREIPDAPEFDELAMEVVVDDNGDILIVAVLMKNGNGVGAYELQRYKDESK